MLSLKGLEGRKRLAELVQYDCLRTVEIGTIVDVLERFSVTWDGKQVQAFEGRFAASGRGVGFVSDLTDAVKEEDEYVRP